MNTVDLIFIVNTSEAMAGGPISLLNNAMENAIQNAEKITNAMKIRLTTRVLAFDSEARWVVGDTLHGEENVVWIPLHAHGTKDTAGAINMARKALNREYLGSSACRPIVFLITTGYSNDFEEMKNAAEGLKYSLNNSNPLIDEKIIRVAMGFNSPDKAELNVFSSVGTICHMPGWDLDCVDVDAPLTFIFDEDAEWFSWFLEDTVTWSIKTSVACGLLTENGCNLSDYPIKTYRIASD